MEKKYLSIAKILISLRKIHYDSVEGDVLVEDLRRNNVEIVDPILS